MNDLYRINHRHLGLGKRDTLNNRNLVSKQKIELACNNEQTFNTETRTAWIKMTKTQKLKKIKAFSQFYVETDDRLKLLDDEGRAKIEVRCWEFLRDAMDKKRINNKDVEYDVETESILSIKSLVYNQELGQFALKRGNNGSSVSSLPKFELKKK